MRYPRTTLVAQPTYKPAWQKGTMAVLLPTTLLCTKLVLEYVKRAEKNHCHDSSKANMPLDEATEIMSSFSIMGQPIPRSNLSHLWIFAFLETTEATESRVDRYQEVQ